MTAPGTGTLRLGPEAGARAVCVLVHGRGQAPEEMEAHILARLDAPDVAFVLPRAATGSWYGAKAVDPLTDRTRGALAAALDAVEAEIAAARAGNPGRPLLLAGFSQGACLSLEYAFSGRPAPDAVAALTGCRVGAASDERARDLSPGLPVYLTGSDADPWIPVTAFAEAVVELGLGQARLRTDLFPGRTHEVADAEVSMVQAMLADIAAGAVPRMAAPR